MYRILSKAFAGRLFRSRPLLDLGGLFWLGAFGAGKDPAPQLQGRVYLSKPERVQLCYFAALAYSSRAVSLGEQFKPSSYYKRVFPLQRKSFELSFCRRERSGAARPSHRLRGLQPPRAACNPWERGRLSCLVGTIELFTKKNRQKSGDHLRTSLSSP